MNIVVVGAGGVGGYFGGMLAKAGFDITFLVRGKTLEAIQANGLKVNSFMGDFEVHPEVTDDYKNQNAPDLVILSVKSWQIEAVAMQLKPIIDDKTMVLPLQNGADNADRLREILPHKNVLAGLCKIVSKIETPGVITHFEYEPEIVFGEYDNSKTERMQKLKETFDKAGFKSLWSENIHLDIWKKFLFIATASGMGAITRATFGVMREDENIRQLLYQTANEIMIVANAKGIALTNQHVEMAIAIIDRMEYNTTASMQRDFMEGRPSELQNFNGYIVEQGKQLHIATPINKFTYHSLLPMEKAVRANL